MIKAVIFDMDDLMINSYPIHMLANGETLKHYGYNLSSIPESVRSKMIGRKVIEAVATTKEYLKMEESVEEIFSKRQEIFLDLIKDRIEPMPGLFELIELLKRSGYDLVLGSSATMNYINLVLEKLNLKNRFKAIVSANDVKNGKPDPEIFLRAAEKLHRDPRDCLVLEDATNGISAAKNAGMKVIGVKNPYTPKQNLSRANAVVDGLDKITIEMIRGL